MQIAPEPKLGAERGLLHSPIGHGQAFAHWSEPHGEHALPGQLEEGRRQLPHNSVGIHAEGKRQDGDDPAHRRLATAAQSALGRRPLHHRLRKAPRQAWILGEKPLQFFARDPQQDGVSSHHGGMTVRFPIEQRPLAQGVPGPQDFLHAIRSICSLAARLASSADDEEQRVARAVFAENHRALRIFRDPRVREQAFEGAFGEDGEQRMRLQRIGTKARAVGAGGG